MEKEFVTYEIASELKELGFDEECLAYYTTGNEVTLDKDGNKTNFVLLSEKIRGELSGHGSCKNSLFNWLRDNDKTYGELAVLSNSVSAPLWQQALKWLREQHMIHIISKPFYDSKEKKTTYVSDVLSIKHPNLYIKSPRLDTYEDALKYALRDALNLIK